MPKPPSAPSAKSVKRKKKPPLDFAMLPIPVPLRWMAGMPTAKIPTTRVLMYPDRRSASSSVPYSKTATTAKAMLVTGPALSIPRTMSSVMCSNNKRIESRDAMVSITLCFI